MNALGLPAAMGSRAEKGLSAQARERLTAVAGDGASSMTDAEVVNAVVALRDRARAAKDFKKSDELRAELAKAGVSIKDGKAGTEWSLDGSP
jgi:cysteinyl-tRNA synthetase